MRAAPARAAATGARRDAVVAFDRLAWLKGAVVIGVLLGLALSYPLWIGPRSYPLAPVLRGMPALPSTVAYAAFAMMFGAAIGALVSPRPRKFLVALAVLTGGFCLLDQTRWQPWVYLYAALLITLAEYSWAAADAAGRRRALNTARLIVAATYIFSGLQKFNANFVAAEFPGMATPITDRFPALAPVVHLLALAAPAIQVAFGVGLLSQRIAGRR